MRLKVLVLIEVPSLYAEVLLSYLDFRLTFRFRAQFGLAVAAASAVT
jgi:hypothetical protein